MRDNLQTSIEIHDPFHWNPPPPFKTYSVANTGYTKQDTFEFVRFEMIKARGVYDEEQLQVRHVVEFIYGGVCACLCVIITLSR